MKSTIKDYNNRATIFINDIPIEPVIYALTDWRGGRLSYEESTSTSIGKFAKAGVKLYQLDINFEDMWKKDDSLDITIALKQIQGILDKKPDGAVFFRLHTNPPKWWLNENPSEWVQYANTRIQEEPDEPALLSYLHFDQKPVPRPSFASDKYKEDMTRVIKRFLLKLKASPEAKALAGIHIASGLYGEHHYWAFVGNDPDMSQPMLEKFRKFTNNPKAQLPNMDKRYNPQDGIFRNPEKEKEVIDYFTFQHELVADHAIHFCKLVKDTWESPIITGIFYCYYVSLFGRAATGGHLAEDKILRSPYIDYVSAPQAYNKLLRNTGGAGVSRGLLESVRLNKKLLLDEVDHPTHLGTSLGGITVFPQFESLQLLRRNVLTSYMKGMGFWYYDFGPYCTSGWWNLPYYIKEIEKLQKVFENYYEKPYISNADVLLVFDTKVFKYTALNEKQDPLTDKTIVNISYPEALKSGASMDTIYLSDIEKVDLDKYKCVVFMNTFVLTDEQKSFIHKNLYKPNRTVLWFFAPGYTDGKKNSKTFCEEVTGFSLESYQVDKVIKVDMDNLSYSMDNSDSQSRLKEVFVPKDGKVLGHIGNTPALALKEINGSKVYFASIPFTSAEVFTYIFKKANVHIYNNKNDALIEGSNLLLIHAGEKGPRFLTFKDQEKLEIDLKEHETILFDINSKEILARDENEPWFNYLDRFD